MAYLPAGEKLEGHKSFKITIDMIKFMFEGTAIATQRLRVATETDFTKGYELTGKWTLEYDKGQLNVTGHVGSWDTEDEAMDAFNEICKQNGIRPIPGLKVKRF